MQAKPIALFLKISLIAIAGTLFSCGSHKTHLQKYSTTQDTLILHTQKQKSTGLFAQATAGDQFTQDTTRFAYSVTVPKGLKAVYRAQFTTDFKRQPPEYIDMLSGMLNGKPVYIVDQNNNRNLADDPVYEWQPIEWRNPTRLVPCTYTLHNGRKAILATSWLNIGLVHGDEMQLGRSEHVTARFRLGKNTYTIGVADPAASLNFMYGVRPQAALLEQNGVAKDSLPEFDLLEKGQYFNLGGQYYRFDDISHDGYFITLVKEDNFSSLTGMQPGMIAPGFTCTTTSGKTITLAQNANRYCIVVNSCGCGGDKDTATAGTEISRLYGDKALVLNVDFKPGNQQGANVIDCENPENRPFYETYRSQYCSRIAYVIAPDGRIIDKFETMDWKNHLPRLFE
jgi:hypothetical protein